MCKVWLNLAQRILESPQYIFVMSLLSFLEKGESLFIWTNLNSSYTYPRSLVKIGPLVLEKKMNILKVDNVLIPCRYYLSLKKSMVPNLKNYPRILSKFSWNWPSGYGEEDENVKLTTNKFWSEGLAWAFGSEYKNSSPQMAVICSFQEHQSQRFMTRGL